MFSGFQIVVIDHVLRIKCLVVYLGKRQQY